MVSIKHKSTQELKAGLHQIRQSPHDNGVLELIVRRPEMDEREELISGQLDLVQGLVGDNWISRSSARTTDGSAHPEMQLNIMNSRVVALIAGDRVDWKLAGDQLFIDLDLSVANLPAGTRLSIGEAIIEVTAEPHSGCKKFAERFGRDAILFVNSAEGKGLCLRGINAKVVQPGMIRTGNTVKKL